MTHLQRATEGTGSVQGVRGGDGDGICDRSHNDSEWASGRGATELENLGHGGRAADISNGILGQGRPAELPGGGMPGPSGNEDGDAGPLPIPASPGHRGHSGGGNPPPPTVHPMRHAGPLEGTERKVPCHILVRQGSRAKEAAAEAELRESS